jgi:hypothetical protein
LLQSFPHENSEQQVCHVEQLKLVLNLSLHCTAWFGSFSAISACLNANSESEWLQRFEHKHNHDCGFNFLREAAGEMKLKLLTP